MTTTLTDKRCRSAVQKLAADMANVYDKAFKAPAPDAFWVSFNELDVSLSHSLEERPIPEMRVQAICANAMVRFREICSRFRP